MIDMKKLLCIAVLLLLNGCTGHVFTVSVPMVFDANDFQYLQEGEQFHVPKYGYYFENKALEIYIRSKIAQYEIEKRGFFRKEGE